MVQNRLRELREAKGFSRSALARLAGTSQQQISRLELNERELTIAWAERLAPFLDVFYLHLFSADAPISMPVVPVLGEIHGTEYKLPDQWKKTELRPGERVDQVPSIRGGPETYAMQVRGSALSPLVIDGGYLGIDSGDLGLVEDQRYLIMDNGGNLRVLKFKVDPARLEATLEADLAPPIAIGRDGFEVVGRFVWAINPQ